MHKKLYVLLAVLYLLGIVHSAGAVIIVDGAASDWEQALVAPEILPDIAPRIIVEYATSVYDEASVGPTDLIFSSESVPPRIVTEYATTIHNETLVYPAALISATNNLPGRIVVNHATSIATGNMVPFDVSYLDVTFPVGGEVLNKGQKYFIAWDSANITGDIQIDLYQNGTNVLQLAAAAPNTGDYEFFIPDYLSGDTDYQIGISAENGQVWNFSPLNFTITPFKCTVQSEISDAEMTTSDSITYRICVENPEATALSDIEIVDPIPAGTSFGSATGAYTYLEPEQEVRWNIASLAPGAFTCDELAVDVTASPGALISNVVSIHNGGYVATLAPYLTDITENTLIGLGVNADDISLSTSPVVLEEFGTLELWGGGDFNPDLPTYVISHGWKPSWLPPVGYYGLPDWQAKMADQISKALPANVFTWNWQLQAEGILPPYLTVEQSAFNLCRKLERRIIAAAPNYQGDIHFIGHSLGSGVAIYTAKYFRDFNSVLSDNLKNVTLLDSPYPYLATPGGTFLSDTKDQLFVDNYQSSYLGRERYANADVNVKLFGMVCWGTFNEPHGFSHKWYSSSVNNFQNPSALCDSDVPPGQMQYGFYWSTNSNVTDTQYYHVPLEPNWKLHSMQDPVNYIQGSVQDAANWVHGQYLNFEGHIIDKSEELSEFAQKTKNWIQVLSAIDFETAQSIADATTDQLEHSSWLSYTVANLPYHALELIHHSDASVAIGMDIPEAGNSLRFSFEIPLSDTGGEMEVFINDTLSMVIRCDDLVQKGWQQSEWIDVSAFAGQHVNLGFRLSNPAADTKGVVHLDDIILAKIIPSIDTDEDTLLDAEDNCPEDANIDQLDSDLDAVGDVCDICPAETDPDQIDRDCDCDVDGSDLAEIITRSDMSKIGAIAAGFGREQCP